MTSSTAPVDLRRGDVCIVDFNPVRGHEQAGRRPSVIVSVDALNSSLAELVIVLPITSRRKHIRSHIMVTPPEGGLTMPGYIKCEDVRSVSKARVVAKLGTLSGRTLQSVEETLRILLGL